MTLGPASRGARPSGGSQDAWPGVCAPRRLPLRCPPACPLPTLLLPSQAWPWGDPELPLHRAWAGMWGCTVDVDPVLRVDAPQEPQGPAPSPTGSPWRVTDPLFKPGVWWPNRRRFGEKGVSWDKTSFQGHPCFRAALQLCLLQQQWPVFQVEGEWVGLPHSCSQVLLGHQVCDPGAHLCSGAGRGVGEGVKMGGCAARWPSCSTHSGNSFTEAAGRQARLWATCCSPRGDRLRPSPVLARRPPAWPGTCGHGRRRLTGGLQGRTPTASPPPTLITIVN